MVAKKKSVSKKPVAKKVAATSMPKKVEKSKDSKWLGALSYLWIAGPVLLFAEKKDKFVSFHARQATALFVAETLLAAVPMLGVLSIVPGIASIYGLVMALENKEEKIPLAYEFGNKIAEWLKI